MVNGINGETPINCIYNCNCHKKAYNNTSNLTNPIDRQTMSSLECLGIYNMSLVKGKENFEHKPAELIADPKLTMNDIQGEKIYKPNGDLDYIVEEKDDFEIKYYSNEKDKNKINNIRIYDINTGNLLKEQETSDNDEGYIWGYNVTEYPQNEPGVEYRTSYNKDLKLNGTGKIVHLPDGTTKRYDKDYWNKSPEYSIKYEDDKNQNYVNVDIDADKNIKNIHTCYNVGDVEYCKDIRMNKGAVLSVNESKDMTVPNYMERDVLNDKDVKPTPKFNVSDIDQNTDGEKTYYQNGNTKTITKADGTKYIYNANDTIKTLITPKSKIEFNSDGTQIIEEYLGDNVLKRTTYNNNSSNVYYKNGNIEKEYYMDSNGKLIHYCIYENGKHVKSASFNEDGYLTGAN